MENNPQASVLVGFQASMLSCYSKSKKSLSKQLSQASNSNFQEFGLSPPARGKNKLLTMNTLGNGKSYLEQLQKKKLDQMSQMKKSKGNLSPMMNESFTQTSQQLMNDEDQDDYPPLIEKYTQLQTTQVKA